MAVRIVPARFGLRKTLAALPVAAVTLSFLSAAPAPSRTVWDGVFSSEQVARGKKGYDSLCRRCHGETLGGGEDSPAVAGKDFMEAWFGKSVGALVDYTRETMPTDGAQISLRQSTDITVFILSFNDAPAGQVELEPDLDVQNRILITPRK